MMDALLLYAFAGGLAALASLRLRPDAYGEALFCALFWLPALALFAFDPGERG